MVMVTGQSGRPTAGVTWSSNNMCNLIWKSSDEQLAPDRLFVAPTAPGFSVAQMPSEEGMRSLEAGYRELWCNTRATIEISRRMFHGYKPFDAAASELQAMPPIRSLDDHQSCVDRLRRIMEDPQQLLSNCVADYIVEQLRLHHYRPGAVEIPGFSNIDYESHAATARLAMKKALG